MRHAEIFQRMRADHRRVLAEIKVLEAAAKGKQRRRVGTEREVRNVLAHLESQFDTHMAAEDDVLFPALVQALPQTRVSVEPLRAEHEALRTMLLRLRETFDSAAGPEREEQLLVQVRDFVDLLRIHVRKEEALVLRVAEQVLRPRELEALAARLTPEVRVDRPIRPRAGRSKGARP